MELTVGSSFLFHKSQKRLAAWQQKDRWIAVYCHPSNQCTQAQISCSPASETQVQIGAALPQIDHHKLKLMLLPSLWWLE
jgi:hypothetical protein